tara:strand:- start:332 stop:484 length:153 start_codon:yes stop_codon:yes gene_type:complete
MLLANEEAVMTVLETLDFVAFNPLQNSNPIAVRRIAFWKNYIAFTCLALA